MPWSFSAQPFGARSGALPFEFPPPPPLSPSVRGGLGVQAPALPCPALPCPALPCPPPHWTALSLSLSLPPQVASPLAHLSARLVFPFVAPTLPQARLLRSSLTPVIAKLPSPALFSSSTKPPVLASSTTTHHPSASSDDICRHIVFGVASSFGCARALLAPSTRPRFSSSTSRLAPREKISSTNTHLVP
ncbi:uncharacterized protein J3D65DRAFT_269082 [Phyllosticta citribraziliensis]|uniref:Uncharacterized protein n=1 Tax=Phyllosticta citribraziliensis TaxID=989973 RepID=A0ABR1M136_9PEZI